MVTVGAAATDWANDGVFGDGWFAYGKSAYSEDVEEYADKYIFTDELREQTNAAVSAGVAGSADIMSAIDNSDVKSCDSAFCLSSSSLQMQKTIYFCRDNDNYFIREKQWKNKQKTLFFIIRHRHN